MKSALRHPLARLAAAMVLLGPAMASAEVVIHEIMMNPPVRDGSEPLEEEFIELHNLGSQPVNMDGWQIDRGIAFTFPAITLPPGGFLTVAASPDHLQSLGVPEPVLGPWEGRLSNSGESLRLINRQGQSIDEVRYSDEGDWAQRRQEPLTGGGTTVVGWVWHAPFDGDGHSLELVHPQLPNDIGQNWLPSAQPGGSPGRPNGPWTPSPPPLLIDSVSHHPPVPTATEPVTVRASVIGLPGASFDVQVHYRVSQSEPLPFRAIPMTVSPEGHYLAEIPPYPDGSVIEFYIAAGNPEHQRTWPSPIDDTGHQGANALYQVDNASLDGESDRPTYRIIMTADDAARFQPDRFPPRNNAQMHATFIASRGGQAAIRYQAGIRHRGNGSRFRTPRSYRINLPKDAPWQGFSELNLVSQYSYLQTLGLHLFQAADLPAPEAVLVQLTLNGEDQANSGNRYGVHYGAYAHIQPLNGEFIEQAFPRDPDGDLYRKVSADPSRDQKRWGVHFENERVYLQPEWYLTDRWSKETNASDNDWSRFQEFIVTMNEAGPPDYAQQVADTIHLPQWVRWFALMTLINNRETALSNGIDDDYSLYQGREDPRAILLPHDLDTIFGLGDTGSSPNATIFQAIDGGFGNGASFIPQLRPFFTDPVIRPLYFQALHEHMETILHPDWFEPFVDSLLPHVPAAERERIKTFNRERRAYVRDLIDAPLRLTQPQVSPGALLHSTASQLELRGTVSPRLAVNVMVNDRPATFDRGRGTWVFPDFPLVPGRQTLRVDALDLEGRILSSVVLEVDHRGNEESQVLPSRLETDLTLTASDRPYRLLETLVVPAGRTLTLEAGAALEAVANAAIIVAGRLVASGRTDLPVTLSPVDEEIWLGLVAGPGSEIELENVHWSGIFPEAALTLRQGVLRAREVDFTAVSGLVISLENASAIVEDSRFPQGPGSRSLVSRGGILPGYPLILKGNALGEISFAERPAEDRQALRIADNTFAEGQTAVSAEGSLLLNNNVFRNIETGIHLHGSAEVLAANLLAANVGTVFSLAENADAHVTVEQSTLTEIDQLIAGSPTTSLQGWILHSILLDVEALVSPTFSAPSRLTLSHSWVDAAGAASLAPFPNVHTNSLLEGGGMSVVDRENDGYPLVPGSPLSGASPYGHDVGRIPQGMPPRAAVRGAPMSLTPNTVAELRVTVPGGLEASYRLDEGPWQNVSLPWHPGGDESLREVPVTLTDLTEGPHVLEIRSESGAPVTVVTWTVDAQASPVILHEVAALNRTHPMGEDDGAYPDWVELWNRSHEPVTLTGYQLEDGRGRRHPVSANVPLAPGAFTVVPLAADAAFALDRDGETLSLIDPKGRRVDHLVFGRQLEDRTLGRDPDQRDQWTLTAPSPGAANVRAWFGSARTPSDLRLNEIYAASGGAFPRDYLELVSLRTWPLDLSGLALTDDGREVSAAFALAPHTFLQAGEFMVLTEAEVGFAFDSWFESLTLYDPGTLTVLDRVFWQGQDEDASLGRVPDGTGAWVERRPISPGRSNGSLNGAGAASILVDWESHWHFHDDTEPPGVGWMTTGYRPEGWKSGAAAFFRENAELAVGKNTPLPLNPPYAHAFRQPFVVDDTADFGSLVLNVLVDDGAVFYLNGTEILKLRMPEGAGTPLGTFATDGVSNATIEGPFEIPLERLRRGVNVLAASVHQDDTTSSDVVFAAQLSALPRDPAAASKERWLAILQDLRITEVMFHPDGQGSEWIEFFNAGNSVLQLEGVHFSEGLTFTFPQLRLAPGDRVVIVSDEEAFRLRYGESPVVAGTFQGRLDNSGESLALTLPGAWEHHFLSFSYDPEWYAAADGLGSSLTLRNPRRHPTSDPRDWQPGAIAGGTPGGPEPPRFFSSPTAEGLLNEMLLYQIEVTNAAHSFSAANLPPGLSIDPETGVISGRPEKAGRFEVILSATNASGTRTQTWHLHIAASGPAEKLTWEHVPGPVEQNQPFSVRLRVEDSAGRVVRDFDGDIQLQAFRRHPEPPPVIITQIRDWETDGLTLLKLDREVDTAGWRLFLNASADREFHAVHGLDGVEGAVFRLPEEPFHQLDLPESELGFNLQWSDEPPEARLGGQRGWALLVDDANQAIDFVIWGYSEDVLHGWRPHDENGLPILGPLWRGPPIIHPGQIGRTLARAQAADSDSASEWDWLDPADVPILPTSFAHRLEPIPVELTGDAGFVEGYWEAMVTVPSFGSQVTFHARELSTGLQAPVLSLTVMPPAPPSIPSDIFLQGLVGETFLLPLGPDAAFESLEIISMSRGLQASLYEDDGRTILEIQDGEAGLQSMTILAENPRGSSSTEVQLEILPDTDLDGLPDSWESEHALQDGPPEGDRDGDGWSDRQEYLSGTDPRDPRSRVAIIQFHPPTEDRQGQLQWTGLPAARYTVERGHLARDGTRPPLWETLHSGWIEADAQGHGSLSLPIEASRREDAWFRVRPWRRLP